MPTIQQPQFIKNPDRDPTNPEDKRFKPAGELVQNNLLATSKVVNSTPKSVLSNDKDSAPLPEVRQPKALTPSEFNQIRVNNNVGESNFDQFFTKDEKGNIFSKPPVETASVSPSEIVGSQSVSPTEVVPNRDQQIKQRFDEYAKSGLSLENSLSLVGSEFGSQSGGEDSIRAELGIPDLIKEVYDRPSFNVQAAFDSAYKESGLASVKRLIEEKNAEIISARKNIAEATSENNNNPFISANSRSSRIRSAQVLFEQKMANLNVEKGNLIDLYNTGLDEVENYVEKVFSTDKAKELKSVSQLDFALKEAERKFSGSQSESQSDLLRFVPDFLDASKENEKSELDEPLTPLELERLGLPGSLYGITHREAFNYTSGGAAPSSTAPFTDVNFEGFVSALVGQESGGNYDAKNERTGAYGAFQIMPGNWPSWSKEYLASTGQSANQSLAPTPQNQDAVARHKLKQYYDRYGNWQDVASMWYSGKPFSQVVSEGWADRRQGDGSEPSVREYVNSVLGRANLSGGVQNNVVDEDLEQLGEVYVKNLSDARNLPSVVSNLENVVNQNEALFGPVRGNVGGANPYDEEAQAVDAQLRAARQLVGKFMEGGVLRKEDEAKYKKLLPDLGDKPAVAKEKIAILKQLLSQQYESYINDFRGSGYDVSTFPSSLFGEGGANQSTEGGPSQGGASSNISDLNFSL